MEFAILGMILFSVCFLTTSAVPIVPEQVGCAEGEPLLGELQPDVNLTVLPGLTFPPLSNITVTCDADFPRFPNTTNTTLLVRPNNIKIYVGTFEVKDCPDTLECVYTLNTFFPGTPPVISCTARNLNNACRFKVANITLMAATTTAPTNTTTTAAPATPPPPTNATTVGTTEPVTPPIPTSVTTTEDDDDTDDETSEDDDSDSDTSDSDSD